MPKIIEEYPLLPLLHQFINQLKKGKHLQKNGKRVKPASIRNYEYLELLLTRFSEYDNCKLILHNNTNLSKSQFEQEKKYWKDFYFRFTNYLYDELNHHDNYVGRVIKLLRCFLNYLIEEKGLNIGFHHKKFYAPSEEVDIVVLSPERLNYLIENVELEKQLPGELRKVKNVFVFGCAVALRYSDLMALTKSNVEVVNNRHYINIQSKKTGIYTKVKLPTFGVNILKKYQNLYTHKLLPQFTKAYFNKKIKLIMAYYGFTEHVQRTRNKRGIPEKVYKTIDGKKQFRFCDAVTSHTMRRSAITTMLSLGMSEQAVRQISGHAANSKEFFRYVSFAQTYIDTEIDQVHERLKLKKLEFELEKV